MEEDLPIGARTVSAAPLEQLSEAQVGHDGLPPHDQLPVLVRPHPQSWSSEARRSGWLSTWRAFDRFFVRKDSASGRRGTLAPMKVPLHWARRECARANGGGSRRPGTSRSRGSSISSSDAGPTEKLAPFWSCVNTALFA